MIRNRLLLTASLMTFSSLAFGQETAAANPINGNTALYFSIAGIAGVLAIAMLCVIMMKFHRLLLEMREKLTFSASTADNGKTSLEAIHKLEGQMEALQKEMTAIPSRIKPHAAESPALSAEEVAAKVMASESFQKMTSSVANSCSELKSLCKDVETKCSSTIEGAKRTITQATNDITAFSQKLSSLDEAIDSAPSKAHSIVEKELDKARDFFADALKRIENASASIASVESQLACLQELTVKATQISNAVQKSEERDGALSEKASVVEKGLADMTDGLAKFKAFSEQIPAAAIAQSNLAESKALLESKAAELYEKNRQLSELTARANADESQLRSLEDEKRGLLAKNGELLHTAEELQKRLEESVASLEQRVNECNGLKSQYDGIAKRLEVLDAKRREAESANSALEKQAENLSTELATAKQQAADATAALHDIRPTYESMLKDRAGLYPRSLDTAPYNAALQALEKLAQEGSANAELCLRDLAMINSFLKQEGAVTKDAQEQMLRVLWYFSKNFTAAMKASGATPDESCRRLNVWLDFFLEMKDEGFALEMPSIGDGVTLSWMTPGVPGTNTVSAVESWAVYAEGSSTPTH